MSFTIGLYNYNYFPKTDSGVRTNTAGQIMSIAMTSFNKTAPARTSNNKGVGILIIALNVELFGPCVMI